ncbi:RagB/SusD family nutrient uptake outer membrane protein [uncultured Algibacter sp.]|uniref:RagB/SusD family nutrient uptake outer membrane protein n=1 Tax=uncultured Algibacter sp. TaxID=298659 RepID=UPI0026019F3B|nr:RagB/SusD family nutrient uptake outer membrane protein [uncultured Algibacter sp.]
MKNTNRIKTIIKGLLALIVLFALNTNCSDDVLNQNNPNVLSPTLFWKTADDANKGIIGAYSPFVAITYYSRFEIFLSDYRDDVVNGFNTSDRTAAGAFNATADRNAPKWMWEAQFRGVSRANDVLFNVPNIEMDASQKDYILGEAYFIRAYNYFQLLNNFLNVPLLTSPVSEIEAPDLIPQAPPADIWAQIEEDLKMAQSKLPPSWPADELGRATEGAATGMLGKVFLYQEKYAEAKAEFSKVMDGRYKLMDDYAHNFTEEFENNQESLFEIQMVADGNQGWGADNANSGSGSAYQPDLAPVGYTNQNTMRVNQWALDLFLDEQTINGEVDPRTYTTFFWNYQDSTQYEGKYLKSRTYLNTSYVDAYSSTDTNIYGNKYADWAFNGKEQSLDGGWHGAANNLRILRYADILLMFAEAEFMLNGSTSVALDAINRVRARVDLEPHASITMQDIDDERVKELTFERTRYFDLLRWGRVKSRIVDNPELKSESGGTGSYKPGREYLAIPLTEIDGNNNEEGFKQNPGY